MLPGFRFLFAAIVLSMSILIFGLGAAALLRTAHEEFASAPTWQPAPETRFAQAGDASKEMAKEATKPVLALMRLDDAPKVEPPASADAAVIVPGESAAPPATGPEYGPIAALPPQDSLPVETAKPETQIAQASATEFPAAESPVAESSTSDNSTSESVASETATTAAENPPQAEAAPAPADTSAIPDETKVAAIEPAASPASEAVLVVPAETVPAAPEQASVPNPPSPAISDASKTIATLGGPAVTIVAAMPAKPTAAKPDKAALKKRLRTLRANARLRAQRAAQQALQQPVDLFGQPMTRR